MNPVVVVPARMASTRLPGKPMALIGGEPMIVHVWRRAQEAALGPVLVAVDHDAVADAVTRAGGHAVMTRPEHPSGTDRIAEALLAFDPERRFDVVVNLQGDLPGIAASVSRRTASLLSDPAVDVATPVVPIVDPRERDADSVVKMVGSPLGSDRFRALYFSRATVPWGNGPLFHHVGLYAWRRNAFERFVALPPSALELREKLEQLRALENGMRVDAVVVDGVPLAVDTPDDLDRARLLLAPTRGAD